MESEGSAHLKMCAGEKREIESAQKSLSHTSRTGEKERKEMEVMERRRRRTEEEDSQEDFSERTGKTGGGWGVEEKKTD